MSKNASSRQLETDYKILKVPLAMEMCRQHRCAIRHALSPDNHTHALLCTLNCVYCGVAQEVIDTFCFCSADEIN